MNKEKEKKHPISKNPSLGIADNFPNRQLWKEIAEHYNGEFTVKHDAGKVLEIHNINIPFNKLEIKISVSDSRPLKFIIEFPSSQKFNLTLSWNGFIEKIIKKFGKPDIQVGWQEFDNHYSIKSNRSDLARKILTKEIQVVLLKYNVYSLSYQTKSSTKTASLISVIQRQAGDKASIIELIEMFKLLILNMKKSRIIN